MKKFLVASFVLLLLALVATVVAFVWISQTFPQVDDVRNPTLATDETTEASDVTTEPTSTSTDFAPVPLKSVPLSAAQQQTLEFVGVDVETFVITSAMQACASTKLEADRIAEITAGDAPSAVEVLRLTPCLTVE